MHKTSLTYVKDKENFIQREKVEEDGSYTYRITEERPALLTKGSKLESCQSRPSEPNSSVSKHVPSHATVPIASISPSFTSKLESKHGQAVEK